VFLDRDMPVMDGVEATVQMVRLQQEFGLKPRDHSVLY
jgi:CheY-like chemotaxis protein